MLKKNNKKLIFLGMMLTLSVAGCTDFIEGESANTPKVSITLSPNTATYNLDDVLQGAVAFSASIRNQGDNPIIMAHPSICFPANYQPGTTRHFKDSHGKSEIILTIIKPSGKTVLLRDGLYHSFDPDNIGHFKIDPDESKQFYVGWFFQNARGRWENDEETATVFKDKGNYKVRILYRNFFSKAGVFSKTNKSSFVNMWTGEMLSNEVSVEIE